ncbi:hypothetical protein [Herminiimonas sp. CN]|uniref:hypothetical protein n=1 Tax=Herminiimonas sp. CN TaxID=1349818 RepID=UPI000473F130|nr:hypothetical protein [Herminiimonas sp. CN]
MNFFGLNRAALNGGASSIVAGAALIIASSGFSAEGTRVVLPGASIAASSGATATGVRTAYGDGGFIVASSMSAFPALLQLQTANIVVTSGLHATYTDAYALAATSLQGEGYIARPGAGVAAAVSTLTAGPLVTAGFASRIDITSSATADASVKLSGQATVQRDGYAQAASTSGMTADGLKTALGYAYGASISDCIAEGIKTHGGAARFDAVFSISAIASTDASKIVATSDCTANGFITQFGEALARAESGATAYQTVTTFGTADEAVAISSMTADGRLALQAGALVTVITSVGADGAIYKMASATIDAISDATAQWALLIESDVLITCVSGMTADAFTNAEALDPPERTMTRPFTDRSMARPFTDRTMRRSA